MRDMLREYYILVAQLEHQMQQVSGHQKSTSRCLPFSLDLMQISSPVQPIPQGLLTLQRMWFFLQPSARTMATLSEIATTSIKVNSCARTLSYLKS